MAAPKLKYGVGNAASSTIGSGMTNTDTSTPVLASSTNFQAAPTPGEGMNLIDEGAATEELLYSTGISGGALTTPLANRGLEGGSPQTHAANATIKGVVSVGMWNDMVTSLKNILLQTTGDIDHSQLTSAFYAADAGANDTYAITLDPVPASYTAITGLPITFKANTANTGAATLNINTLGAKTIKKLHDQDLADNDIESGQTVTVVYDGTNFQMQSQIANTLTSSVGTDGWTADSNTWVYASASTFTIAGVDLTATYTKGTKLKFTNSGTKYAVVASSSFSTNTTVTIVVNTDYVITNAAISAPYYSYQGNPQGYPGWFNFAPSAVGWVSTTTSVTRFSVIGRTVHIFAYIQGTSNATTTSITVPITSATNAGVTWVSNAIARDNGTDLNTGSAQIGSNTTSLTFGRDWVGTAWTNSGAKLAGTNLFYEF